MQNTPSPRTYPKSLNCLKPLNSLNGEGFKGFKGVTNSKALTLLRKLRASGFEIFADGEKLRYRGPAGALAPELLASMREQKPALLRLLDSAQPPAQAATPQRLRVARDLGRVFAVFPNAKYLRSGDLLINGARYDLDNAVLLAAHATGGTSNGHPLSFAPRDLGTLDDSRELARLDLAAGRVSPEQHAALLDLAEDAAQPRTKSRPRHKSAA